MRFVCNQMFVYACNNIASVWGKEWLAPLSMKDVILLEFLNPVREGRSNKLALNLIFSVKADKNCN